MELGHSGLSVNYGDFSGAPGSATVWKLHGSCNMLPQGMRASRGVTFTRGVAFGTAVRGVADLNEAVAYCLGDNALPPVMSLFMKGKPIQVSPGTVAAVQERWRSFVADAEKIAVVGVRPNLEDSHLWEALANSPAHLYYVGNAQAFEAWRAESRGAKPSEVIGNNFRESFDRLVDEIVR